MKKTVSELPDRARNVKTQTQLPNDSRETYAELQTKQDFGLKPDLVGTLWPDCKVRKGTGGTSVPPNGC